MPRPDPGDVSERCPRCLLHPRVCLCADIPVVPTRTRVVLLRHVSERRRSSNSGRVAALALPNAAVVEHGARDAPLDTRELSAPGTWLVYPEGEPRRIAPSPPPERLVFLDATWQQAKRMRQRLPPLRGLPVLRLPDDAAPVDRLRESPGHGLVSTLEAVARALRLVEGDAPADALERLFARLVERAHAMGRIPRAATGGRSG